MPYPSTVATGAGLLLQIDSLEGVSCANLAGGGRAGARSGLVKVGGRPLESVYLD